MSEPIKIASLQLENVKRVRAVSLSPSPEGLTIIGGRNGQGKTSVLDAIAWALGGNRYRPADAHRDGSVLPPQIRIRLTNGLLVERKGKNSDLTVTDPTGKRHGQKLLDAFVSTFAIDLPAFLAASDKEKADALLQIIGVGDQLTRLDREQAEIYNRRHAIGQIATQKQAYAKALPWHEGLPDEPVSASELIQQQQQILLRNAENQRKRHNRDTLRRHAETLRLQLEELTRAYNDTLQELAVAEKNAAELQDESTAELEENIRHIDDLNVRIRQNLDRTRAEEDAKAAANEYGELSIQLDEIRRERQALLDGAQLPLPGLTVEDGVLRYKGHTWDCMSGAEQLIVGTAIARALNPLCGFVLLDKLEQLDAVTLDAFSVWLKQQNLQAIATRVSTGSECTIIIEDGGGTSSPFSPPVLTCDAVDSRGRCSTDAGGTSSPVSPPILAVDAVDSRGRCSTDAEGASSPFSPPAPSTPTKWKAGDPT